MAYPSETFGGHLGPGSKYISKGVMYSFLERTDQSLGKD